jgi:hypothetical protein
MLFFHGCFRSGKRARGVADTLVLRDQQSVDRSSRVVLDDEAWARPVGASDTCLAVANRVAPMRACGVRILRARRASSHSFRRLGNVETE